MTTSGSYSTLANLNIAAIIDEAFRRCRIDPQTITSDHLWSARMSLELLFVEWYNDGVQEFIIDQQILPLVGDGTDFEFTMPAGSIDILSMVYRNNQLQDIQIKPISRQDYLYINDKTIQGQPLSFFVDKTTMPPVVKLWPVQNITGTFVVYNRLRQIQDVGLLTNTPDVTILYTEAVISGLAAKLAGKYADDAMESKLIALSDRAYNLAVSSDRERAPYVLKPRIGRRFYYGV